MNNEETLITNDPTVDATQYVNNEVANEETTVVENTEAPAEKKTPMWQKVAIGGTVGIALGVGGFFGGQEVYAALKDDKKKADDDDKDEDDEKESKNEDGFDVDENTEEQEQELEVALEAGGVSVDEGIEVAVVDESLSFTDAFNAARAEVGPGGVFAWHGNVYTTYTADEWENLSAEEMGEFVSHISVDQEAYALAHQPQVHHETVVHHEYVYHEQSGNDYTNHSNQDPVHTAQHVEETEEETGEGEIEILGIEHDIDLFDDGTLMTVGAVAVGDDVAYVLDVDQDGYWDATIHDDNGNGKIDDGEVRDVSDYHESVEDWEVMMAMQNMEDNSDYADYEIQEDSVTYDEDEESYDESDYSEYAVNDDYSADDYTVDDVEFV